MSDYAGDYDRLATMAQPDGEAEQLSPDYRRKCRATIKPPPMLFPLRLRDEPEAQPEKAKRNRQILIDVGFGGFCVCSVLP